MEKFLIVRLGAMGDVIHGLPAAAALRQRFPESKIGWLVERRWAALVSAAVLKIGGEQRPLVDTLHLVDTFAWRKQLFAAATRRDFLDLRRSLRSARYSAALDLQGALKSAVLMSLSGAGRRYGFAHPRESIAAAFYSHKVNAGKAHVIEQNLELVCTLTGEELPAVRPQFREDRDAQTQCDRDHPWSREEPFILLVPGAGWGAKQWPTENYGALAAELARRGMRVMVNTAPSEQALATAMDAAAGFELPKFQGSASELVELTRRARLLIGGDTGPVHMANLMGVPVIAIFGPTDPARNGPFFHPSAILRSSASRTSYSHSRTEDSGIRSITVDEVLATANRLLAV